MFEFSLQHIKMDNITWELTFCHVFSRETFSQARLLRELNIQLISNKNVTIQSAVRLKQSPFLAIHFGGLPSL